MKKRHMSTIHFNNKLNINNCHHGKHYQDPIDEFLAVGKIGI